MHIKKLILLLFLIPVLAQAQKTTGPNYTYIAQRYEWIAGMFKGLGLPAGDSAQFQTGQELRAGAIYYDSTGVDSGLYVWSGLAWRNYDPSTLTASEGITKVGSDFQLGGTVTSDRTITVNNGSFKINKSKNVSADYMFLSTDTVSSPDLDADIPFAGFLNKRTLRFPSHSTTTYRAGAQLNLNIQIKDSATLNTVGGDFSPANKTTMVLEKMSGYSGRSVYVGGTAATLSEGVPIQLSDLTLQHSTSTTANYRYAKNYWVGNRSYLVIGQADTLEKWVGFHNMGFMQGTGHVPYTFDYVGGFFGDQSAARVANPWFLYGHSTRSKSFIAGPTGFGDSTIDASALVDISSTTKGILPPRMSAAQRSAIGSPASALFLWDSDSTRYMGYDGSEWRGIAWTGEGGGTPGIDDVLAIGQSLTTNRTINTDASGLTISGSPSGSGNTLTVSNSNAAGNALSVSSNGVNATVFSNNTKTSSGGGWAYWGQSVGTVPTATFVRDSSSTNTIMPVLNIIRRTTGTGTDGIGGSLLFSTETGGSDFISGEIGSKWAIEDQSTRTSEFDIMGVDNAVTETFMNIQKDLVRINNNADTLATKAYARSVGGGGGGDVTKVGTPSNHQLAIWTGDGTIKGNTLTGNRALVTDADGEPIAATTTDTEIGYVNGVTSNIQAQINSKFTLPVLTSGSVIFSDGTTIAQDNANLFWDNTNNLLGIGTTSPVLQIHASSNSVTNRGIMSSLHSTTIAGAFIAGRKSRGTAASPTTVTSGDYIATYPFQPYVASSGYISTAYIGARVNGTVTGTAAPSEVFISTGSSNDADPFATGSVRLLVNSVGNIGIGTTTPTAKIHIAAGTATASTAPLKFTAGTNLTTPEAGAVEFDGTNYFATASTTRYTIAKTLTATATLDFASTGSGAVSDLTITVTGAADGDAVTLGVPNGSVTATATYSAWVSAANTVTVRFSPKATEDPASGTFRVSVIKY